MHSSVHPSEKKMLTMVVVVVVVVDIQKKCIKMPKNYGYRTTEEQQNKARDK